MMNWPSAESFPSLKLAAALSVSMIIRASGRSNCSLRCWPAPFAPSSSRLKLWPSLRSGASSIHANGRASRSTGKGAPAAVLARAGRSLCSTSPCNRIGISVAPSAATKRTPPRRTTWRPAKAVPLITEAPRSIMQKVLAAPHCPEASPLPVSGIRSWMSQVRSSRPYCLPCQNSSMTDGGCSDDDVDGRPLAESRIAHIGDPEIDDAAGGDREVFLEIPAEVARRDAVGTSAPLETRVGENVGYPRPEHVESKAVDLAPELVRRKQTTALALGVAEVERNHGCRCGLRLWLQHHLVKPVRRRRKAEENERLN